MIIKQIESQWKLTRMCKVSRIKKRTQEEVKGEFDIEALRINLMTRSGLSNAYVEVFML